MGGSSSQTVGYKYFAGLQVVLGNCIERILNINPDNRGWILSNKIYQDILKDGDVSLGIAMPNIFGGDKQEGGWVGMIDIHTGRPEYIRQNEYLAEHDSDHVSSFPYLSYVVFKGFTIDKGFQLVSMSGMLKDVLYWPKRIHIKDNGSAQWYDLKAEIGGFRAVIANPVLLNADGHLNGVVVGTNQQRKSWSGAGYWENTAWGDKTGMIGDDNLQSYPENSDIQYNTVNNKGWARTTLHHDGGFGGLIKVSGNVGSSKAWEAKFGVPKITALTQSDPPNIDISLSEGMLFYKQWPDESYGDGSNYLNYFYEFYFDASKFSSAGFGMSWDDNSDSDTNEYKTYFRIHSSAPIVAPAEDTEDTEGDLNPIHKIREIITDDTAMNKPEAMINDVNFMAAADRIYDEGLGVSGAFTEKSCKEAIDELLYHIEAGIRVNRQTGLYEIILFRDDLLDLDNAQIFDKSNIKTFSIETANIDDVINSVNVNYYDRDNIKDSSFSLDELGSILSNQSNAETLDFPYFMNRRNAELVGNWKLKQLSTPTRKGSFTTGKYDARKINRYDVVKLTWHNQNMIEVPIRIMKIGLGDGRDNTVTLDWVEVIPYSSIVFPTINVDPPTSVVLPPQPNQSIAFEMPYFEAVQRFGQTQVDAELANNPDLGYLMVATKKPQNNSINALLFTDNGTGYQQASIVDYCPVVQLDQNIGYLDTSFAVKNVSSIGQAEIGTLIICEEELMVYQSFDDVTKILTVKRAALDTVPKPHLQDAVFYFYDAFNAFDSEQYVLSEVIDAKVLTTTPSGIQELSDATALSVEMDARPIRPYPPADVKINGEHYPQEVLSEILLTWVDRNRVQQTGGSILGWTDAGVTVESGVTYILIVYAIDSSDFETEIFNSNIGNVNTYTIDVSTETTATSFKVVLKSVRDSYESYQQYEHIVSAAFSAPYNIEYTVREV